MTKFTIPRTISTLVFIAFAGCAPGEPDGKTQEQSAGKTYKYIAAKTGLRFREGPHTTAKIFETIAPGKIVQVRADAAEKRIAQGEKARDWTPVNFLGRDGWVYSRYLKGIEPAERNTDASRYPGRWTGTWDCMRRKTHLKIEGDQTFTGWIFGGGDAHGCSGEKISGTWAVAKNGNLCLSGLKKSAPCFFIWNNRLIADMTTGKALKENYGSEVVSGLRKTAD